MDPADAPEGDGHNGGPLLLLVWPRCFARLATDIIFGVMWSVEVEPEVEEWLDGLAVKEFALVLAHLDRLAERGSGLRMPASRSLGDGLFELRFDLVGLRDVSPTTSRRLAGLCC